MNKVVIIGAGKTGRGFIGRLAAEAGCEIRFVDANQELVDRLNNAGKFEVSFFGGVRENVTVSDYTACTWEEAELSGSELIFVSVGGQNLEAVGEMLKAKLPEDVHHTIITCENASSPADKLQKIIARSDVTVSEATVFCTTIDEGEVDIASENYPYLQCDRDRLNGYIPFIPAVKPVGEFGNFLTRKLYTYNAASCVIAYLGAVKGYTVYSDAANDPEILELLDRKFGKFFCIAVLRCSELHDSDLFNKRQMSALRRDYPNSMSVVYRDAIVLFLNQDEPILLNEGHLAPLVEFARRNRPFSDILKINIHYQQTLNTLGIGEFHDPDSTVYHATDLLPQYLFSNCPYAGLEAGIHHHLFRLQDHDERYHTEFVHTLRTFLECDRNAAKSAEHLHLHRSTFFYRMKKMEELLDISLSDSKLLLLYELSFKIWDYLSK